jgi:integrase
MARPGKNSAIDFSTKHELTHGLVDRATCPEGLPYVLLKDARKKGLRIRVTKVGGKHWQFETRVKGKLFSKSLGEWPAISIEKAREIAHRLRGITEQGVDPRVLEEKQRAMEAAETEAQDLLRAEEQRIQAARATTVYEAWNEYLSVRKAHWGDLHYRDHVDKSKPGGLPSGRRGAKGVMTSPGPLASLMSLPLFEINQQTLEHWASIEGKVRPSSTRLAWRLLTVFLNWCSEHPKYSELIGGKNPSKSRKIREALGKPGTKSDVLQREQLSVWFSAVRKISNPVISIYLQITLLTGARPGEVLSLKWEDINEKWKRILIRDKYEGTREIPATKYVLHLLSTLPRKNEWVFSSPTSKSGRLSEPNTPHTKASSSVGINKLTLNGLRRSFRTLTEWLEVPVGIVAQIQGHKPSATAEKHYTRRPLELLRVHHERIEKWILDNAEITFESQQDTSNIRLVRIA